MVFGLLSFVFHLVWGGLSLLFFMLLLMGWFHASLFLSSSLMMGWEMYDFGSCLCHPDAGGSWGESCVCGDWLFIHAVVCGGGVGV